MTIPEAPAAAARLDGSESSGSELSGAGLSGAIEALLLLAEEPIPALDLAQVIGVPEPAVTACLVELAGFYDRTGRGFELRAIAGGWRYYTRAAYAELITAYVLEGRESKLSQAALETLAVVAYSQPVSRTRISAIRGVNVDGVIKTLLARGLIEETGHDPETAAVLFQTSRSFLERMGLQSLDDLPPLAPHLPEVSELEAELGQLARDVADDPAAAVEPPSAIALPGDPAGESDHEKVVER